MRVRILPPKNLFSSLPLYLYMWNIKIKWPGKKWEDLKVAEKIEGFTLPDGPLFNVPFRDYLDILKTRNPEEEFAIRALKSLCTSPEEYGLAPSSKTVFGIYCFDCRDQDWYTRYFAKMLSVFKPLWRNLNDRDFLRKLGIVFLRKKEDAIGFNLRGVMVSKKWVDFLTGKYSVDGFERNCKVLSDWYEIMNYFEIRMRARFLNNYFIMMSSDENAKYVDVPANPRIFDLQSFIERTN